MKDVNLGGNLIFILSQPRTGSTLLTRLLSGHSEIDALGETRILQPALMPVAKRWTELDSLELKHSRQDVDIFLESFPEGKAAYYEGMRRMFSHIYSERLKHTGKSRFLDKTPRYAYFIPELYSVFPKAKYIFLWRHPLAVLSSIVRNWTNYKCPFPNDDLELAPSLLLEGKKLLGDNAISLQYEELVAEPKNVLQPVCQYLDLNFEEAVLNYDNQNLEWKTGDQLVYDHKQVSAGMSESWINHLSDPGLWQYSWDYLEKLGEDRFNDMGYNYGETRKILEQTRPSLAAKWFKRRRKRI